MYQPMPGSGHGSSASISGPFYGMAPQQQQQAQQAQHPSPIIQQPYLPKRSAYFESHWPLYSADWGYSDACNVELIAVGSFTEDSNSRIQVTQVEKTSDPMTGIQSLDFQSTAESTIEYPVTKLGWEPRGTPSSTRTVKMVSTSDCLRLWEYDVDNHRLMQRAALINKSKSEYMPPLTSFDWNKVNPTLVITSSIDTTCTIWDISTSQARTQLIAHDSEVYDCTFVTGSLDIFTSVGADGSVRVFDLRSLDHSTIIYEPAKPVPLVRVAANPFDRNILATLAADSNKITLLDIRNPGGPLATLDAHQKPVNSIAWVPPNSTTNNKRHVLASAGDDCQVLLWDLTTGSTAAQFPLQSSYTDATEINNITWNHNGEWLGWSAGEASRASSSASKFFTIDIPVANPY